MFNGRHSWREEGEVFGLLMRTNKIVLPGGEAVNFIQMVFEVRYRPHVVKWRGEVRVSYPSGAIGNR